MANTSTQKFINYTREAFFSPVHLIGAAIIGGGALVAGLLTGIFNADATPLVLIAGGLELMWVSAVANNPRFIRQVNSKYQQDIDKFYQTKTLIEYYNSLSLESQQRFDKLQAAVKDIREGFRKMNSSAPEMLERYGQKLGAIESSYAKLLYFHDRFPKKTTEELQDRVIREIDDLNRELKSTTNERLRQIKEKRMKLLRMQMDNFQKVKDNREITDEQLQTFEEIVAYLQDQPMALNTASEDAMIDNLLFETEQTQQSLEEIENIMSSSYNMASAEEDESSLNKQVE